MKKKSKSNVRLLPVFLILLPTLILSQQYDETDDDGLEDESDDCAFISGQHCDQKGICKYCAMCLQSSCILSKTITNNGVLSSNNNVVCNTTQFGTTNLYNWYDYCLSSGNDNAGNYCATSTECYQYRKSVGPTVTYAWHNLTCNPSSCMLIASDGAPPPVPPPFSSSNPNEKGSKDDIGTSSNGISKSTKDDSYYHNKPFHNPAAVALTVVCSLVLIVASVWVVRLFKKKNWWPHIRVFSRRGDGVARTRKRHDNRICTNSISSVPRSAPPSFSSTPPEMAIVHCSHEVNGMFNQNTIYSARSSASSSQIEPLPSYLSPDSSLPKYEQAIVTQIRGWRSDDSSSSSTDNQITSQPLSSMWVPVYFSHPSHFRHFNNDNATNLYGVPSQHLGAPLQSFWIHPTPGTLTSSSPGTPNQSENDSTRNENATTNTDVNANTNAP